MDTQGHLTVQAVHQQEAAKEQGTTKMVDQYNIASWRRLREPVSGTSLFLLAPGAIRQSSSWSSSHDLTGCCFWRQSQNSPHLPSCNRSGASMVCLLPCMQACPITTPAPTFAAVPTRTCHGVLASPPKWPSLLRLLVTAPPRHPACLPAFPCLVSPHRPTT